MSLPVCENDITELYRMNEIKSFFIIDLFHVLGNNTECQHSRRTLNKILLFHLVKIQSNSYTSKVEVSTYYK